MVVELKEVGGTVLPSQSDATQFRADLARALAGLRSSKEANRIVDKLGWRRNGIGKAVRVLLHEKQSGCRVWLHGVVCSLVRVGRTRAGKAALMLAMRCGQKRRRELVVVAL